MPTLALIVVLCSAFIHASWNLLARKASGGIASTWIIVTLNAIIYAPLAAYIWFTQHPVIGLPEIGLFVVSAFLQVGYFLALQRGYKAGDFSVVYPLARGTGPMLSSIAAIILFGERPTPIALAGAAMIGIGVIVLTGGFANFRRADQRAGVFYGLLVGVIIATSTIWDTRAVARFGLPPLFYDWASTVGRFILLTPLVLGRRDEITAHWAKYKKELVGVAALSPFAYILVLSVLVFAPVTRVAPMREISILIGTFIGVKYLGEGAAGRKLVAACLMVAGVIALAFG
ncbi:MAG TPA: DMT family transporter [Thermoflexales bacterium]|nr:DMT family transporter [Thermoflexales bacterium]HQW33944.1 DMT family transporter [Thermoflexales bacterium]HQZ23431.1 DMT family transporter [Thermoflexales bacterium]HRA00011.1 DMT family transporter [Thermoflexales bacterium]